MHHAFVVIIAKNQGKPLSFFNQEWVATMYAELKPNYDVRWEVPGISVLVIIFNKYSTVLRIITVRTCKTMMDQRTL